MVFIRRGKSDILKAYLTTSLTPDQLNKIHTDFESGSGAKFLDPSAELFIADNPDYHGKSLSEIRRAETEAGNTDVFLVIDEKTPEDGGIWYIDQFATEDEVEDGEAESEKVLWKIRIKTAHIPLMHSNFSIANTTLTESLDGLGVEFPVPVDYEQSGLLDSGMDVEKEISSIQPVWLVADPGEWEESIDPILLKNHSPRRPKVVRLKPSIAAQWGLKNHWTVPNSTRPHPFPDGSGEKTFPEGSMGLQMQWDPDADVERRYTRLEGSL